MGATAATVMNADHVVVKPDDLITRGIDYIMQHRYRNLPVVDDDGKYLGTFGVHCLLKNVLPKAALMKQGLTSVPFIDEDLSDLARRLDEMEGKQISMCMNTEAVTVAPDTPLVETLLILYKNRQALPVVDPDTGKLAGVISYWDVGKRIMASRG